MFGNTRVQRKVFVGVSGGVDSSVTLALLRDQGYDVTGVYIKGWYPDWTECHWKDHRRDAMRVCAQLDVPFLTCDLSEEYKKEVVDYFLEEYKKGRTPNPDVMCNKYIKFGSFYTWARQQGAQYVATGHYARTHDGMIYRGIDTDKDQSYFLWAVPNDALHNVLFPLGNTKKERTRQLAKKYALPTAIKKDSQGICFLEDVSMEEFLKHYFPPETGNLLDESGKKVGTHDGAILYTIGQRHGFLSEKTGDHDDPYFVIAKDLERNTVTVSHKKPVLLQKQTVSLSHTNWFSEPKEENDYAVQFRYRQQPTTARVELRDAVWTVILLEEAETPVSGQSCVVYDNDKCLGGGVIN